MNYLRDVIYRLRSGQSERRIAVDLQLSRPTVHKYHELAETQGWLRPERDLPAEADLSAVLGDTPRPPQQPSSLAPYQAAVLALLDQGLETMAVYDRLRDSYGYAGSYSSVLRYVHRLCPPEPEVVVRIQCAPGEEAQVDFGTVGKVYDLVTALIRTVYVFVATLSYSRHQYAELVFDQTTPTWIGLHRRAFASWGGVPQRIVLDNLKAAVVKAQLHDPILGEAYRRLAQHYGFLVHPNRPATPQHKGKVENGVHYVQRNFWAGQNFTDLRVANEQLQRWVTERAGTRRHGTTHQAPLQLFADHERAALLPLPDEPFELLDTRPAKVHPDCHVVLNGSYYSVPYRYVGQTVEAHLGERLVQLYHGQDLLASHPRAQQRGEWHARLEDYPRDKAAYLERTPERCRQSAARLGPATHQIVATLLADRPLDRLRSVQSLLGLEETVGPHHLEAACARAVHFGDLRYRRVKEILNAALDQQPLPDAPAETTPQTFTFARSSAEFFAAGEEESAC
jgi:transposase